LLPVCNRKFEKCSLFTHKSVRCEHNLCHWALYSWIIKMNFTLSETSKGKQSLLYDGFAFRIDRVVKSGDISWRCTVKNCKGRIKTDEHSSAIINGNCNHTHESDSRSRLSVQLLSGKQHPILQHAPLNWSAASY
jgi:hypothetical protein